MNEYNLDKLIKVEVRDAWPSMWYTMRPERMYFFGLFRGKAGVYGWDGSYLGPGIPAGHIVKDGDIFEKPEVVLHFQDGYKKYHTFNTFEAASTFAASVKAHGRWI